MFDFNRVKESCYFDLPTFDLLPYLRITTQYQETNLIKYGITLKFGWLFWQYRMFIGKYRISQKYF